MKTETAEIASVPDDITLTRDLIFAGQSEAGGWNRVQLEAIGITWKDKSVSGWIERNCGRTVSRDAYHLFLALIGQTKAKRCAERKAAAPVKYRQCCGTPKSEWHSSKCFNNPRNWKRR